MRPRDAKFSDDPECSMPIDSLDFFGPHGSNSSAGNQTDVSHCGQLYRHRLPARYAHPLVANDGSGAPTLTDVGASVAVATVGVTILLITVQLNVSSVWVRVVELVSNAIFEGSITADPLAPAQFVFSAFTSPQKRQLPPSPATAPRAIWRRISERREYKLKLGKADGLSITVRSFVSTDLDLIVAPQQPFLEGVHCVAHLFRSPQDTLPNNRKAPSTLQKLSTNGAIPSNVRRELCLPELRASRWAGGITASIMAMPEAAVHEDDCVMLGKHEVWPS
jgi:hypothetical protein